MRITEGLSKRITELEDEDLRIMLGQFIDQVAATLNGGIDIPLNTKAEIHLVQFNAPNTEVGVTHTLGRVANGYIAIRRSVSAALFDGPTSWTSNRIFVRSGGVMTATLLIF